jgi:uncharacterized protein (TIGR00251 family)
MLQQTNEGLVIKIKVIPKSASSGIVGWENDELKIRIAAVPDKGAANAELIRFLSNFLKVGKSKIVLISGETSRHKKICVNSISLMDLQLKLPPK